MPEPAEPVARPIGPLAEDEGRRRAVEAGVEALAARKGELRDLHHVHAVLDANARHWVAEAVIDGAYAVGAIRLPNRPMVTLEVHAEVVGRAAVAEAAVRLLASGWRFEPSTEGVCEADRWVRDDDWEEALPAASALMRREGPDA